jgi:hypothetical protein
MSGFIGTSKNYWRTIVVEMIQMFFFAVESRGTSQSWYYFFTIPKYKNSYTKKVCGKWAVENDRSAADKINLRLCYVLFRTANS